MARPRLPPDLPVPPPSEPRDGGRQRSRVKPQTDAAGPLPCATRATPASKIGLPEQPPCRAHWLFLLHNATLIILLLPPVTHRHPAPEPDRRGCRRRVYGRRPTLPPLSSIIGVARALFFGSTSTWTVWCWLQRWEARRDATLRPYKWRPEEAGNDTEAGGAAHRSSSDASPKPNEQRPRAAAARRPEPGPASPVL
jgi:hypothetical protein